LPIKKLCVFNGTVIRVFLHAVIASDAYFNHINHTCSLFFSHFPALHYLCYISHSRIFHPCIFDRHCVANSNYSFANLHFQRLPLHISRRTFKFCETLTQILQLKQLTDYIRLKLKQDNTVVKHKKMKSVGVFKQVRQPRNNFETSKSCSKLL